MTTTDATSWTSEYLIVVDVEGNGATPPDLVELGIVVASEDPTRRDAHQWLVRPSRRITSQVTRIHKITNEMVEHAPAFGEIAASVLSLLDGAYVVGHGVQVDVGVLRRALPGWMPRGTIDTLRLARRDLPGRKSYGLSALTADLKIVNPSTGTLQPHRALYDATMTVELFLRLAYHPDGRPRTLAELLDPLPGEVPPPIAPPVPPSAQGSLL